MMNMHKMAQKGWEVHSIKYSSKSSEATRRLGYEVYTGHLETVLDPQKPFDLIVGWIVLEHLHEIR